MTRLVKKDAGARTRERRGLRKRLLEGKKRKRNKEKDASNI
jgi:hypothetical protein